MEFLQFYLDVPIVLLVLVFVDDLEYLVLQPVLREIEEISNADLLASALFFYLGRAFFLHTVHVFT